jgi:hydroxymethylbilane synthase
MLAALGGGCLAPIAACGQIADGRLLLTGRVLSFDGAQRLEASLDGSSIDPEPLGRQVAELLVGQGAKELIDAARK